MRRRKLQLFLRFLKLGFITLGGGYGMIPLMEREMVAATDWMKRDQFYGIVLLAQSVPGAIAVNTAVVVGVHLEGALGGALSALGVVLPSFGIIVAIAAGFPSFHAVPAVQAVFRGISAVVVALIAAAALRLAGQRRDFFTYVTGGLGLCALLFLRISPFLLVLVLVPVGIARALIRKHNGTSPDTNAGMTLGD